MLKNKRVLLVAGAIMFIVLLFFLKTKSQFKNDALQEEAGLAYGNLKVEELLNKDTDDDGVLDWEESLWGTDPTKKDTDDDGIGDSTEVAQMKPSDAENEPTSQGAENLTQTDEFSRELFATVTALTQTGQVDQDTVDALSSSLVEQIKNSPVRKNFILSDIKTTQDNSLQAVKNYDEATTNLSEKYRISTSPTDILNESIISGEEEIDAVVLSKLDPIIEKREMLIDGLIKMNVPSEFASLHLNLINAFQRSMENLNDIRHVDGDAIVALSAISKYEENITLLEQAIDQLNNALSKKLNS